MKTSQSRVRVAIATAGTKNTTRTVLRSVSLQMSVITGTCIFCFLKNVARTIFATNRIEVVCVRIEMTVVRVTAIAHPVKSILWIERPLFCNYSLNQIRRLSTCCVGREFVLFPHLSTILRFYLKVKRNFVGCVVTPKVVWGTSSFSNCSVRASLHQKSFSTVRSLLILQPELSRLALLSADLTDCGRPKATNVVPKSLEPNYYSLKVMRFRPHWLLLSLPSPQIKSSYDDRRYIPVFRPK